MTDRIIIHSRTREERPNDGEYPLDCLGCQYPARVLTEYEPTPMSESYNDWKREGTLFVLCSLCAATPAGNATEYPSQFRDTRVVLQTVNYAANAVLHALEEKS